MNVVVTFRNAITDARQEIDVAAGLTLRQAVEESGFLAPGAAFSIRNKNGEVVDDQFAAEYANTVLSVGLPGDRVVGGGGGVEVIVLASTLGPLIAAFATQLGNRFGDAVANRVSRIFLRQQYGDVGNVELHLETDKSTTIIELSDSLSDEARLAFIDLNIEDHAVRGRRLRWDGQAHAWVPERADNTPAPELPSLIKDLRPFIGLWVAVRDDEVLVAAPSAKDVLAWLTEYRQQAQTIFRVPDLKQTVSGARPKRVKSKQQGKGKRRAKARSDERPKMQE